MYKKKMILLGLLLACCAAKAQNVGIGTTSPQSKLSVGTNSEFQVDQAGNLIRINNVPYSFPSSQGAAGQVLTNSGTGTLSWSTPQALFGDGSAGSLNVPLGNTLDLTTLVGNQSLPQGFNYNFTNITIGGTLIVSSGVVLKATGNFLVSGTIIVAPNRNSSTPHAGVAAASADVFLGGKRASVASAAHLVKAPLHAGGGGKIDNLLAIAGAASGGEGGGGVSVYVKGSITVQAGASINVNGSNGVNTSANGVGAGGGAGGVIVLASQGTITNNGSIRANGGSGANGANNSGTGEGGGGGGGGGIVLLITQSAVTGSGTAQVNGGAAGNNSLPLGASTTIMSGGGGGACGGDGGNGGGGTNSNFTAATVGGQGYAITLVVNSIEHYILGR
jgi:hypothetical protein